MKGNRCCICDGPIVNGRCKLCGMPYQKNEELYHVNEQREVHMRHASQAARDTLRKMEIPLGDEPESTVSASNSQVRHNRGDSSQSRTNRGDSFQSRNNRGDSFQNHSNDGSLKEKRSEFKSSAVIQKGKSVHNSNTFDRNSFNGADTKDWAKGKSYSGQYGASRKKSSTKNRILLVVILIILFIVVLNILSVGSYLVGKGTHLMEELHLSEPSYSYEGFNFTSTSDNKAMPAGGEAWEQELAPGLYTVGCQLPQGTYDIWTDSENGSSLTLEEDGNYEYVAFTQKPEQDYETDKLTDRELFAGTILDIQNGTLRFSTENGQVDAMKKPLKNENTQKKVLKKVKQEDVYTAGEDFEPGWYDLSCNSVDGYIGLAIEQYYGEDYDQRYFTLNSYLIEEGNTYRNLYLKEGDRIIVSFLYDTDTLELIPCEEIYAKRIEKE